MKSLLLVLLVIGCGEVHGQPFGDKVLPSDAGGSAVEPVSSGGVMAAGGAPGTGGAVVATGGMQGSGGSIGAGGAVQAAGGFGGTLLGSAGGGAVLGAGGSAAPPVCYSNKYWAEGGANDAFMRPGSACNSCHTFSVAGTLYVTNDPTNCYGIGGFVGGGNLQVEFEDANMHFLALTTNEAGNFWTNAAVAFPLTMVATLYGSGQMTMQGTVTSGDCNSCHTAEGLPGRITPP